MRIVHDFPRAVRVIENLWIPMADGCRLAARVWLPDDAEADPVPALLEYMPYRKRDFTRPRDEPLHHYMAGHGYASIRLDLRGSGESDGVLLDEYLEREQLDALEAIAWIARQPWCDGKVGMFGISWGGFNALQVAAWRPPALKAVVTLCSTDDRYADDAHYAGGCLLNHNLDWGATFLSAAACPPDPAIVGEGWRETWRRRLEALPLYPAIWMRHPHRDAYWRQGSIAENYADITCAVYAVGGWSDGYVNAIPRMMENLSCPRKGLIGPWAHAFPHVGAPGPAIGFFQEMLRWWDYWLKGRETGIMDEPMIRVWLEDYVAPAPVYTERPGRWVAEETWPSPRITARRWYLNVLSLGDQAAPEDRMRIASPQTTGLAAGDWYAFGGEGESPVDQRPDDGKSLVFDSDPMAEPLEILGTPTVELELAVDKPVAMLAVRLCDVAPDGASARVSYGLLNLGHRDGHGAPKPVVPGERMRVRVPLNAIGYAFAPGHTLRVAVSTCYWPVMWPAPEAVRLTLFTGVSTLDLPVRPPRAADADLAAFLAPEAAAKPTLTALEHAPFTRSVSRDLTTDVTTYRVAADGGEFGGAAVARIEEIDLTVGYTVEKCFTIHEYDPRQAVARIAQTAELTRGDWSARVEITTELRADHDTFHLGARVRALDGGAEFLTRAWSEAIPRQLL